MSTTFQQLWSHNPSPAADHRTPPHGVDVMDPTTLYTRPASFYAELVGPKLKAAVQMWDEQENTIRGRAARWMKNAKRNMWEMILTRPTEISTCLMVGVLAALILAL